MRTRAGLFAVLITAIVAGALVVITSSPASAAGGSSDALAGVTYANQHGYRSSIGVLDTQTGSFWGAGDYEKPYASESVVKTFIATRLLVQGQMTGWNQTTAYKMITQSDDASADALYGRVGGAGIITWIKQTFGIADLGLPPVHPGNWGGTQITARGMVLFYNAVKHDPAVWPWLGNAMHNATVHGSDGTFQFFGIPSATTGAAIKQGWGADNPSGTPDFNSTGFVNGDRYAVAILTQGPGYGTPIANMLTSEARILMPGGLIVNNIPVGRIDHITRVGRSTFSVDGWAFDPSSTGASTRVDVYVGSSGVPTQANIPRPDVAAAYGLSGNAHGFDLDVAAPSGTSRLCVYAIGIDPTVNTLLGCSMVTVGVPTGHIDVFRVGGSITIAGWAFAPGDPDVSTRVDFYVGGKSYSTIASGSRPDVAQAYGLTSAAHGFGFNVQLPVGSASACVYAIGTDTTLNENLGCQAVSGPTLPVAVVDSISPVAAGMTTLTGWAFDPTNGSASSRVDVYVGPAGFSTLANIARPDVQAAYALTSAAHGFSLKVAVPPGVSQLCVYAIALQPAQHSLSGCTAVTG